MTKVHPDPEQERRLRESEEQDEIEILEVVALDEDAPASAAGERLSRADGRREVLVELDERRIAEKERSADTPDPAPTAASGSHPLQVTTLKRLQQLQEDFDNYERRVEREREATERQASAKLVERMLPILDDFERALSQGSEAGGDVQFRNGVALIFRQLLEALRKEGLRGVESVGQPFDPTVHEAVETAHCESLPHHTVLEELQRGYWLHDKLLRPALVKVSTRETVDEAEPAEGEGS